MVDAPAERVAVPMISVVIPTHECERALVPTLAALVPGAAARHRARGDRRRRRLARRHRRGGRRRRLPLLVSPAIARRAARGGSRDGARAVAVVPRARHACPTRPGSMRPVASSEEAELTARARQRRRRLPAPRPGGMRGRMLAEALVVMRARSGPADPPSQGLLIAKALYDAVGGHRPTSHDPEARPAARRLGRRRIVTAAQRRAAAALLPKHVLLDSVN